jgi:hypothetical protein
LICLILWPNYLALALPGLPWITALRLTGIPMAALLLICLSTSKGFRDDLNGALAATPGVRLIWIVFVAMQFVTLPFSKYIADSISKTMIQQIEWASVFLVSVWVCRIPGRANRYLLLIALLAAPLFLLIPLEAKHHKVLWSGHIPALLKVDDPVAAIILGGQIRGATGEYRAKATFTTPLGLGEYMACLAPFALHAIIMGRSWLLRLGAVVVLGLGWYSIRAADARLGVVGYLVSFVLYVLYWGLARLRRDRRDLVASAVAYAYPALVAVTALAVETVKPLHDLVLGGAATQASNAARQAQLERGIPKILANPIGHGTGMSGTTLGYGRGEFITVDNYWLTIALDYGVVGLAAFLLVFALPIASGARAALKPATLDDPELRLLAPLVIALSAFLIMKLVFSQPDNHPLFFALAGVTVALIYRAKRAEAEARLASQAEAAPAPLPGRVLRRAAR